MLAPGAPTLRRGAPRGEADAPQGNRARPPRRPAHPDAPPHRPARRGARRRGLRGARPAHLADEEPPHRRDVLRRAVRRRRSRRRAASREARLRAAPDHASRVRRHARRVPEARGRRRPLPQPRRAARHRGGASGGGDGRARHHPGRGDSDRAEAVRRRAGRPIRDVAVRQGRGRGGLRPGRGQPLGRGAPLTFPSRAQRGEVRSGPMDRERVALYAGTIAAYADMYITQSILPMLAEQFGIGAARAGLTVSAVVLAIALASAFYGPLSDAIGRCRVVAGAIGASVVGGLLGRVLAGAVAARAGWQAPFVLFAVLTALAAALLVLGLSPGGERRAAGLGAAWSGMLGHLHDPRLVGAYLVGAALFFGWIGIFTYLPFHLAAPPYRLPTAAISSVYLVYAAGVVSSPIAGRLSGRIAPRTLIGVGLAVEGAGMLLTLARPLPLVVLGLVILVLGTFTAQAVAPAFVNVTAETAKGGASALYLTSYYVGGTLGSALPGLAFQAAGWRGVVLACAAAVGVAMVANAVLCGRVPRGREA